MKKQKKMDLCFAVFNCHINDGLKKATTEFKEKFGSKVFKDEISPLIKDGIMSIFQKDPNKHTQWFAIRIQQIVNKGRS